MTVEADPLLPAADDTRTTNRQRVAFESLRERTDELELIISGISLLSLLTLPSWVFEQWAALEVHVEGQRHLMLALIVQLASGLSYTMAGAFLLHLAVRGYWVGLIGLKAAFPAGIRWNGLGSIGPIARDYHRRTVVDLDSAIDGADRVASIIFALVSLVTLSLLWIGGLLLVLILSAITAGSLLGIDDTVAGQAVVYVFLAVSILVVAPSLLLDNAWAARYLASSSQRSWRHVLVERVTQLQGILFPQRLVLPVQLTLESNLPRWGFSAIFMLLVALSLFLGGAQERIGRDFAIVASYDYVNDADIGAGMRSAHYENQRSPRDVLLRVPLIPADQVADAYLRVFLPHLPERDNRVLRQRCTTPTTTTAARHACLTTLWTLSLDGKAMNAGDFMFAERRDLGMRGLQGYLSLAGLAPGRHELRAIWNAHDAPPLDKPRDPNAAVDYRIAFWFSPPYQQDLVPASP